MVTGRGSGMDETGSGSSYGWGQEVGKLRKQEVGAVMVRDNKWW